MSRTICAEAPWRLCSAALAFAVTVFPTLACETAQLTLIERPLNDVIVDVGYPEQDSIGDFMIWANNVYGEKNAEKIGEDSGWCVRTAVGRTWECAFTLSLAEGRINASGTAHDGEDTIFAVVGGTGKFTGVTGEMTWLSQNQDGLYKFVYDLRLCSEVD